MSKQESQQQQQSQKTTSYSLVLKAMSKRRTWACLFVLAYTIILTSSWNFITSILSWYNNNQQTQFGWWPAVCSSLLLGVVFGILSMVAALAVAVPATLVIWITVIVLLSFCGKPNRALVVEGRKVRKEIVGFVLKVLVKEGNVVAAVCAVFGFFALFRRRNFEAD